MLLAVAYALAAIVVTYLLDWSVFARVANIVSISRLSAGHDDPDFAYRPLGRSRLFLGGCVGFSTFVATISLGKLHQILAVVAMICAVLMLLITYGEVSSDPKPPEGS